MEENNKEAQKNSVPQGDDGLTGELEQCKKERDEYLAGWQRAKADFINYKKEEMIRLQEIAKYAAEDLIEEMIAILDSFDLGIAALEKAGPVEKGIYMIRAQIEDVLRKRGLERIRAKTGDPFDPEVHEAIAETESDKPAGTILEEIEVGYRLHGKIVRPARVKVSKGK